MQLNELTWEEAKSHIKISPHLIVPLGSCIQHSRHLPLNTDILICENIARFISRKTKILMAPTVNYGVSLEADRQYSGSTTMKPETYSSMLREIISWWKSQGIKTFFLLITHGVPEQIEAIQKIGLSNIHFFELLNIDYNEILDKQKSAVFAGEAETSVMLSLYEVLVRKDLIEDFKTQGEKSCVKNLTEEVDAYPTSAEPHKGVEIIAAMREKTMTLINNVLKHHE